MLTVSNLHRQALAAVSFSLAAGECVAVRGPSGAGKSLLLRALADLDPSEGDISLEGRRRDSFTGPQWRRLVGYVPAEPGWWADSVGEHFLNWEQAIPLLERLGLPGEARHWPITRPSTGERLRLALVRALLVQPTVLLLDEPTAALDPLGVAAVEALMAEQVAAGLAILWVTHDAGQAARISRRCLQVESGTVTEGVTS